MAACTPKSIFYHVPKTGGKWVKAAMRRSGLLYHRGKNRRVSHPFHLKREHSTPDIIIDEDKVGRLSFCFVRHPVDWLKSFWCYRARSGGLDLAFPPDRIWDDSFERFVLNVLERYPRGLATELYQFYVGADATGVDFIGRQENLTNDLVAALTLAGENFDESAIRTLPRRNLSASLPEFGDRCLLDVSIENRVLDTEKWVMETFYG